MVGFPTLYRVGGGTMSVLKALSVLIDLLKAVVEILLFYYESK